MKYRLAVILLVCASIIKPLSAEVVVRMEMQQAATTNFIDVKLFVNEAPLTVTNFLNYAIVNNDYNNSFIHRNVPGYIVQGGGFMFDTLAGVQPISQNPEVVNEFGRSNLRGTMAMAKLNNLPDSATNQWFFNLSDNSAYLDGENGGYTVFGEVLNNGMTIVDGIANMPVCSRTDINAAFFELPMDNCAANPVQTDNLMMVKTVKQLFSISPDIKFGLIAASTISQSEIIVENSSNVTLQLGNISAGNFTGTAFGLVSTSCSNVTLNPGVACSIFVQFAPTLSGSSYLGSLSVPFPGLGMNYVVALSGLGGASLDEFFTITPNIDFGSVPLGKGVQPEVTIINTGNDILQIGRIASPNPIALPFNFGSDSDRCSNIIIQPGGQCSFMVRFEPNEVNSFADSFNVEIINYDINHEVILQGVGTVPVTAPDIYTSLSSLDYGVVDVLDAQSLPYNYPSPLFVTNKGDLDMNFISVNINGPDAADVYVENLGCAITSTLAPTYGCNYLVRFKPLTPGIKNAIISINTNDPDENPFDIPVTGIAIGENDGVPATIEDAGPNNGDGNNDDVLDSKQSNVATLVDAYGNYVTYITSNSRFKNVSVLQPSAVAEVPAGLTIGSGIFNFTVEGVALGGVVEVGVTLPAGINSDAYYVYAESADNPAQHWYDFVFDGETGAFILGDFTFTTSAGAKFTRNLISLVVKDGGRGDADKTVNGVIVMTGAVSVNKSLTGSSGAISLLYLLCAIFILFSTRCFLRAR